MVRGIYCGSDSLGIINESNFFPKHFSSKEQKSRDFVSSIFKHQKWIKRKKIMMENFGIFEIRQEFLEIGWFEFGNSFKSPKSADLIDFPLRL